MLLASRKLYNLVLLEWQRDQLRMVSIQILSCPKLAESARTPGIQRVSIL